MGEVGVVVMVDTVAAVMRVVTEEVGVVREMAGQMAEGLEIDSILGEDDLEGDVLWWEQFPKRWAIVILCFFSLCFFFLLQKSELLIFINL